MCSYNQVLSNRMRTDTISEINALKDALLEVELIGKVRGMCDMNMWGKQLSSRDGKIALRDTQLLDPMEAFLLP